ncbi:MAG: polysaccharide deacetylase family protein [Bacteroidetes bacterium]|nr:polysaccharide deacetylase family protein [Candidatus Colenecus caballi]
MKTALKLLAAVAAAATIAACKPNSSNIIALSFDDGPSNVTGDILDILESEKVKASFFVVGSWAKTDEYDYTPYMLKAYRQGHAICNHTWDHPYMTRLTAEQMTDEIERNADFIESVIGERPAFFRPPYINVNKLLHETVALTFINGINCSDWEPAVSAAERSQRILDQVKDGDIILMHDMMDNVQTVEALKTLIPELKARGFELVTVPELFKRKGVTPQPHNGIVYSNALQTE